MGVTAKRIEMGRGQEERWETVTSDSEVGDLHPALLVTGDAMCCNGVSKVMECLVVHI